MAVRILWDEYETALLIDACAKILEGEESRKDAIKRVSASLRKRAIDNGLEIDEIFRNENGIALQLANLQQLMLDRGDFPTRNNSKLFKDMVHMYKTDRDQFNKILAASEGEKREMNEKPCTFREWLSINKIPVLEQAIHDTEEYAAKKGKIKESICEIETHTQVVDLIYTIKNDRLYRLFHGRQSQSIEQVLQLYDKYIEHIKKLTAEQAILKIQGADDTPSDERAEAGFVEKDKTEIILDTNTLNEASESTVSDLNNDDNSKHIDEVPVASEEHVATEDRITERTEEKVTNISPTEEVQIINKVSENSEEGIRNTIIEFSEWLEKNDYAAIPVTDRVDAIQQIGKYAIEQDITKYPFFSITDFKEIMQIWNTLFKSPSFRKWLSNKAGIFSTSVNYYIRFLNEKAKATAIDTASSAGQTEKHTEKDTDIAQKTDSNIEEFLSIRDPLIERLKEIELNYYDLRGKGGCLWIVGGLELTSFIVSLNKEFGISITFKPGGGKATSGQDAWWTTDHITQKSDNNTKVQTKTALGNDEKKQEESKTITDIHNQEDNTTAAKESVAERHEKEKRTTPAKETATESILFSNWLKKQSITGRMRESIIGSITKIDDFAKNIGAAESSIYLIIDHDTLENIWVKLCSDDDFEQYQQQNRIVQLAFNKYVEYRWENSQETSEKLSEIKHLEDRDTNQEETGNLEGKSTEENNHFESIVYSKVYGNTADPHAQGKNAKYTRLTKKDFSNEENYDEYKRLIQYSNIQILKALFEPGKERGRYTNDSLYYLNKAFEILKEETGLSDTFIIGKKTVRVWLASEDYKKIKDINTAFSHDLAAKTWKILQKHFEMFVSDRLKGITPASMSSEELENALNNSNKTSKDIIEEKNKHPLQDTIDKRAEFADWLRQAGTPPGTSRTYVDGVERIAAYLLSKGVTSHLYEITDTNVLERLRSQMANDKAYASSSPNANQHLDLYAFRKYISFRSGASSTGTNVQLKMNFASVLRNSFENGFRPNSMIDKNRFRQYYQEQFGEELNLDDNTIVRILKEVGAEQDGRIFVRETFTESNLLSEIQKEIEKAFQTGASCVYISAVYERFQDELASELHIYSVDVMKEELLKNAAGAFNATKNYFYTRDKEPDADSDVFRTIRQSATPMNYRQLQEKLWYIPLDVIKRSMVTNPEIVNVAQETYFYARNLPVSPIELNQLAGIVHEELLQRSFITDTQLRDIIQKKCPSIAINTQDYTTWGLRNSLAVLLKDSLSFRGPIISELGKEINTAAAFTEFCKAQETMTLDELKDFAKEFSSNVIYWESVYEVMVRISQDEFVQKDLVHFDVESTDHILGELIENDYLAIKDFTLFLYFPVTDIKWNNYVLESYIAHYSRDFQLLHASYTATGTFGAIARRNSSIKSFGELVTDVLTKTDTWSNEDEALALLVNKGYLQRRRLADIKHIVTEASLIRESRRTEK